MSTASSPRRRAHASKRRIGYTHPRLFRRSIARNARGFRRGQRRFRISAPRLLACARVLVPSRMSNRSYTRVSLTFTDARCSHSMHVRAYVRARAFPQIQRTGRPVTSWLVCEGRSARERCSGGAHTRLIYVNLAAYVYMRRLYLCTYRPTAVGRASFVECGLILMGTDDKQRKQASSLPGEICLLLPGLQWGPIHAYTCTSTTTHDHDVGKDGCDDENYDQDVDLFQRMRKQYGALGSIGHTRPSSSRALGYHDRLLVAYKSRRSVLHRLPRLPTTRTDAYK